MKNENNTTGKGVSLLGLTGLAFIILKLCHVIDWSWWLVTLPLWGGLALVLVLLILWVVWILIKK